MEFNFFEAGIVFLTMVFLTGVLNFLTLRWTARRITIVIVAQMMLTLVFYKFYGYTGTVIIDAFMLGFVVIFFVRNEEKPPYKGSHHPDHWHEK